MSTRVVERVDDWDERSFSDGYRGLHDLADKEFSGVVRAGGAELFMTKGVVVGVRRGDIETFEDASGTAYAAPTPALPLLAIMQERSDEVRAQYYTEETAISEVDRTLGDGGFTGYIELSENVLSGDYYLVYHRGRSMGVAYVGNSGELVEGDEAVELANDEVGIYEVRQVDIDAIEIPEPEPKPDPEPEPEPDDDSGPAAAAVDTPDTEPGAETDDNQRSTETSDDEASDTDTAETEVTTETAARDEPAETGESREQETGRGEERVEATVETGDETEATGEPDVGTSADEPATADTRSGASANEPDGQGRAEPAGERRETADTGADSRRASAASTAPPETGQSERVQTEQTGMAASDATSQRRDAADDVGSEPAGTATEAEPAGVETTGEPMSDAVTGPERSSAGSAADLETRAIPSLDPELTESVDRDGLEGPRADAPGRRDRDGGHATAAAAEPTQDHDSGVDEPPVQSHSEPAPQTEDDTEETDAVSETDSAVEDESETPGENAERLRAELEQHRERIDRLESELARMETERDDARAKLATVQEERDELQERVDQLEAELGRLEEELGAATDAQRRITPQEALDGTDLFVRYHSKGDGTLEKAHDSGIRREEFTENLRLEKHTQFETAGAAVNGQTYDEFLEDTVEYKFVRWVVRDLLFEIQSTGHTETLADLYDALPKINRVELNGAVSATDEDNNETTETFDVVFRARMGDPLLVANINDSRQGATEGMMENLITAAERVGKSTDDFAAAFLVTQSFFEPPALEAVAGATRGGLLSRDKRKSFVNLSRKQGYHLCLVEARNENFHLEVPEL